MRDACLLARRVAAEGELEDPRVPAPPVIRPVLGFNRLSAAAYRRIQRAVDEDAPFRARVAEQADEDSVGRAGWLWLHRPDGWEADQAFAAPPVVPVDSGLGRLERERAGAEAKAAKLRRSAEKADADRRRAVEHLAEVTEALAAATAETTDLRRRQAELERERNEAMRARKDLEAELATARRDLRLAREATRQAEAELLAGPAPADAPGGIDKASGIDDGRGTDDGIDRVGAKAAVDAAARAAADLTRALAAAAQALGPEPEAGPDADLTEATPSRSYPARDQRSAPVDRRRSRRSRRVRPTLPPGVFEDSPEAERHLVTDPAVMVVVDGYNLARAAWSGLEPEEERRRTVTLLEEVRARSGAPVLVVFDGDDTSVAPPASRSVRVRFSATGVTADDDIASVLAALPSSQAVVVVSTDRAVAADARAQGAAVLSSAAFLAAVRR